MHVNSQKASHELCAFLEHGTDHSIFSNLFSFVHVLAFQFVLWKKIILPQDWCALFSRFNGMNIICRIHFYRHILISAANVIWVRCAAVSFVGLHGRHLFKCADAVVGINRARNVARQHIFCELIRWIFFSSLNSHSLFFLLSDIELPCQCLWSFANADIIKSGLVQDHSTFVVGAYRLRAGRLDGRNKVAMLCRG